VGLIPLALSLIGLLPSPAGLVAKLAGPKAGDIAQDIVNVAQTITGQTGDAAVDALKGNPQLLVQYQTSMAQYQAETTVAELNAQRDVIMSEAKSESWLARNWRPISMMTFTAMIVLHWFGLTAVISDAQVLEILAIIKYGLSGYVVGRSGEKIASVVSAAFKGK
jgi:hypothetical protein